MTAPQKIRKTSTKREAFAIAFDFIPKLEKGGEIKGNGLYPTKEVGLVTP